ncbi:unnamed protein product [marine sediment metagenome]|uniref:Uncharacterized protein n=1 Tax=marine sediment metagenome TaxID=412755 RepID=X1DFC2_9ZZZZ
MIKNAELLERFEYKQLKKETLSYRDALKIYESMWLEAKALGILPLKNPMEGIEVKIKISRILNSCSKTF